MLDRLTQRFPTLTASTLYGVVVALVYWPFFVGRFLINESSDMRTGYAFREFAAAYFREHGHVPQWIPYEFGGMPFAANTAHGDMFYPTFLLRLLLGVDTGMTAGFVLHTLLAGIFAFVFLRAIGLAWGAAFVGGAAYLLSGQVLSLVSPGHDGKLFVSALLPLAFTFLYRGVTRADWRQYVYLGVTVGLALLSPHFQMTYYLLMAIGFFWVYLAFVGGERPEGSAWWKSGALFAGALAVGFAIAAIQLVPFFRYIPFSPRGTGGMNTGWEHAISWSMPPEELINLVWPAFSGVLREYWGRNPFKLHSEYAGVAVMILATFAFRLEARRRLAWFFTFLAAYGALFALGGYTPFYRLPYHLLPMISKTRAPSMIFYLTSFAVAVLAAMGTQALLAWRSEREAAAKAARPAGGGAGVSGRTVLPMGMYWWLGVLVVGALLASIGGFKPIMTAFAPDPSKYGVMEAVYGSFILDAWRVLLVGIAVVAVYVVARRQRWTSAVAGFALGLVVMLDLWSVERHYVQWSPPAEEIFAPDAVVQALKADTSMYRVLPAAPRHWGSNYYITHRIRTTSGYNAVEVNRWDELLGGKGTFQYAFSPQVWQRLFSVTGVKYVLLDQPFGMPGLSLVTGPVRSHEGDSVYVYRADFAEPYAFLVPAAIKVPDEQAIPAMLDPRSRFDARRIMLVPPDAPVGADPATMQVLPEPIATPVQIRQAREGRLVATLAQPLAQPALLFVAENWLPGWNATVDGSAAPVIRANYTLMGVQLPAGARSVELEYDDPNLATGRMLTIAGVLLVAVALLTGWITGRRRRVADG